MYAESAGLTVWSTDGHFQASLSHEKIANAVNKAFPPRNQPGRPNRVNRSR